MRAAFITLAILIMTVAPAAADAPKAYTSAKLGFSVLFPYEVKETLDDRGGGIAAAVDPKGVMYMVGVMPQAADELIDGYRSALDAGLKGAAGKVGGKITSTKDVKLGSSPGREAEIELTGAHATFRAYLVGTKEYRVYLVGVVNKEGVAPPIAAPAFFASFKLTGTK
jgi:hypothetical protein